MYNDYNRNQDRGMSPHPGSLFLPLGEVTDNNNLVESHVYFLGVITF